MTKIVIVGGGIAGASLAIALKRQSVDVVLVEKDPHWTPSSSGIFLYANGLESVRTLGVLDAVLERGWASDGRNVYLTADGSFITETHYPSRDPARVPPIVGIKRSDLHRALADEVQRLGVDIKLGLTVESFDDQGTQVIARLSDGSEIACDGLIGADGIRSSIRERLFGKMTPEFTGFGTWRSVHKKPKEIDVKIMMMGVGKRLGIMPISDDQLYIFATTNEPSKPLYDTSRMHEIMREKLAEFKGPAAALLDELTSPEGVLYTAVEEMALPLPWSKGRVLIIGDGAHACTPYMGQGGAMALEDSILLAPQIAASTNLAATFTAFGALRHERCSFVRKVSRQVGDAGGKELPNDVDARNRRLQTQGQSDVDSFYARMFAGT
ncbi:MAG TPA: FAD-dependent oxidoreductase [Beijerinckiaceae bacterium]|jgi:2-polyprenyl-6-methoxyphenol hydroxylase-like FAD-dependent oxidoreductase|nr:FAD-dependent oxidoreductase [Beijerinckiaceae bacterium]